MTGLLLGDLVGHTGSPGKALFIDILLEGNYLYCIWLSHTVHTMVEPNHEEKINNANQISFPIRYPIFKSLTPKPSCEYQTGTYKFPNR